MEPVNYGARDTDRRVREATQQAFEQLILKVKKNLAPCLKSIMGYWLISQCDTYLPAASAAKVAFQAAFPTNKQPEALKFCKEDVLNVLQDHLLKDTPETLSDPQTVPEEEREAKYLRVVTCSLLALKKLLYMLPASESSTLEEKVQLLISQNKFWKYSKHKTAQVRAAFYELISALCQHLPRTMKSEAARVCPAVLLSIDDSDAVVCPPLWEAVLYILSTIEDCWNYVNAKKGVLPKLWTVLKEGGRGLAVVIHPNLLPFISKLPQEIIEPKAEFFNTFFKSMILGLSSGRALMSHSECSAIIAATMECLQYTLLQNSGEKEEETKVQQMLVNDHFLQLMDLMLKSPAVQNGILFHQTALMLASWEKRVDNVDDSTAETFGRLLNDFWGGFAQLCVHHVDVTDANEKSLAGISGLLNILRKPDIQLDSIKKNTKIRFAEVEEGVDCVKQMSFEAHNEYIPEMPTIAASDPGTTSTAQLSHRRRQPLEDLVCRLAELSVVYVNEQNSSRHLRFLSELTSAFPSREVFHVLLDCELKKNMLNSVSSTDPTAVENPAVQFLNHKLLGWLKEGTKADTHFLVDILYSILHCCHNNKERKNILDRLFEAELNWTIFLCIIEKAHAEPAKYCQVSDWLKGEVLGEQLVLLADELCFIGLEQNPAPHKCHSDSWTLLSLVLSQHGKNEALIGEVYVERIIDKLHAALSKAKDLSESGSIEPSVSFICDVASSFFSSVKGCLLMSSAEDLLLTIFQLCAQSPESTHLSDTLLNKLHLTWQAGVSSLLNQHANVFKAEGFLYRSAHWVKKQIQNSSLDVKSLRVLMTAVCVLLDSMYATDEQSQLITVYIECIVPSDSEWERMHQSLPLQPLKKPILNGKLSVSPEYADMLAKQCSVERVPSHLCTAALLCYVILHKLELEAAKQKERSTFSIGNVVFSELLYALQWCEELEHTPAVILEYCGMLQEMEITYETFRKENDTFTSLLEILYNRSSTHGSLWSLTLAAFIERFQHGTPELKPLYGSIDGFFPLNEAKLHTLQNISAFLLTDEKEELVAQCTARLMTCLATHFCNIDGGFGYLAVLNSCLNTGSTICQEILREILHTITSWREDHENIFLFNCNLQDSEPWLLGVNTEMIRFLSLLISLFPSGMIDSDMDFILCSMVSWMETACDNVLPLRSPLVQLFACMSCDLVSSVSAFFHSVAKDVPEMLPPNLMTEWKEFFEEGIHGLLLPLFVNVTDNYRDPCGPGFPASVLTSLGKALVYIPLDKLSNNNLFPMFITGQKTHLPDKLQTLLNTIAPLLLFRARPVQVTAFCILNKIMQELPKFDSEDSAVDDDEVEEPVLSPPAAVMSILETLEDLLENILGSVLVGEFAVIHPLSEEYCCVLAYLLTWKLLLTFFKAAPSQLRVLYSQYLRRSKSLHKLLYHLFRLMPESPVLPGQTAESGNKELKTLFSEEFQLSIKEPENLSMEIPHLACCVYYTALMDLPAMVRLWWSNLDKRTFGIVDKFTGKYVSNKLSSQEISSVQTSTQTFTNMTVKARLTTREVIATYSVDDVFIELCIQLPQNYPLGSITVESGKRVGVSVQQWRNWMLQLNTYLTHQNGSIMEGLCLWKNNVDKRFEGVEDCMICFSVIHGSNYSLPKKGCKTCKKKFHSACLYKWFTSSNKSTCPLCRETFF
ncbi:E3 ubiquitin-protein ligase listerin-like [Protopterus annectens]|uniref:E3 ubiquitin-protein ligase listerin-like n=1 Tax=Protopterus annectens TaxID=7888 RepID=UPI001CFB6AA9|nr:E3 ubiquitin-protein ligase listerin-like [Protopterus annectens]